MLVLRVFYIALGLAFIMSVSATVLAWSNHYSKVILPGDSVLIECVEPEEEPYDPERCLTVGGGFAPSGDPCGE